MLFYSFKNYEEFKKLFPIEKMNNGKSVRRNAMLLNFYKSKGLLHDAVRSFSQFPDLRNVAQMEYFIEDELNKETRMRYNRHEDVHYFALCNITFSSRVYELDDEEGICKDDDAKSIRYVLTETGKVYKMKATKFFSKVLNEYSSISKLNPKVVNYYASDVLAKQWEAHATEEIEKRHPERCELHVDDDFERIYNSDEYADCGFGSCMTDKDQHYYYKESVHAKAAYMTNSDDKIVARAIIFTRVTDEDGNKYRLCERQYAVDEKDTLKRILVNKLIAAGEIDGYKKIGANCHATTSYVSNNGEDWSSKKFRIECNLEDDDILSYQDSFIYYDIENHVAYNHEIYDDLQRLDLTDRRFHEQREYDSYHDEYCEEVVDVYYHGHHETCDADDLDGFTWCDGPHGEAYYHNDDVEYDEYNGRDTAYECVTVHVHGERTSCSCEDLADFVEIGGEYYHNDDVCECFNCGETILKEDAYASELPEFEGEYFCCKDCMKEAEDEIREECEQLIA